jgi:hypothetical protein
MMEQWNYAILMGHDKTRLSMSWILLDRINESMLIGINEDNDQCKDNA